jgi:hypothetical protein
MCHVESECAVGSPLENFFRTEFLAPYIDSELTASLSRRAGSTEIIDLVTAKLLVA